MLKLWLSHPPPVKPSAGHSGPTRRYEHSNVNSALRRASAGMPQASTAAGLSRTAWAPQHARWSPGDVELGALHGDQKIFSEGGRNPFLGGAEMLPWGRVARQTGA